MTVAELIAALQKFDPEAVVILEDAEFGAVPAQGVWSGLALVSKYGRPARVDEMVFAARLPAGEDAEDWKPAVQIDWNELPLPSLS